MLIPLVIALMLWRSPPCSAPTPGAATAASPSPSSGIAGIVVAWPTMPVCRAGIPCSRPLAATVEFWKDGRLRATVTTKADGRFRVALPPGTYDVRPRPLRPGAILPRPESQRVVVTPGASTTIRVVYDTGIR